MTNDLPELYEESYRVSRKQYSCCECHKKIKKGEKYKFAKGKWSGEFASFKTCLTCDEIKNNYISVNMEYFNFDEGVEFGNLFWTIIENGGKIKDYKND